MSQVGNAQGCNTSMGGNDGNYQSLAERFSLIEKKNDIFNLYINFSASGRTVDEGDGWHTGFANKELRLEIKGNLTNKLFYRFRHTLNKSNVAKSEDNFAKATDMMMVGYNLSDKFTVMAGKITQIWGGFEYDENPMYIYQYSDFLDHMDIYTAGAMLSYKPVPTQEIALEVANSFNGKLSDEYGDDIIVANGQSYKTIEEAKAPLMYVANWNGSFLDDKDALGLRHTDHGTQHLHAKAYAGTAIESAQVPVVRRLYGCMGGYGPSWHYYQRSFWR